MATFECKKGRYSHHSSKEIIVANEKENDLYPYNLSVILAWKWDLLYISLNIFCKTYGQVCRWHSELLGNRP